MEKPNQRNYQKNWKSARLNFVLSNSPIDSQGIGDERGFVTVNSRYQYTIYRNIYAAGVAVAVKPPPGPPTPVACRLPKTGYMSEVMAKVARTQYSWRY